MQGCCGPRDEKHGNESSAGMCFMGPHRSFTLINPSSDTSFGAFVVFIYPVEDPTFEGAKTKVYNLFLVAQLPTKSLRPISGTR